MNNTDPKTINNLIVPNLRIFVFGTLRSGERLDFYMEGGTPIGLSYIEGQLMKSENGNAFIDINEKGVATIGEVHLVNFYCLQRIHHLETASAEFPKGYDLDILPVWSYTGDQNITFNPELQELAFFYKRRNEPTKVFGGDWTKEKKPLQEIERFLKLTNDSALYPNDIINYIHSYLRTA